MLLIAQITTQKWSNLWRKMCIMACINKLIQILRGLHRTGWIKTRPSRNYSYEWKSLVTRTRTELVSMWTATVGIHANSCFLELVHGYSYSYQCECTLRLSQKAQTWTRQKSDVTQCTLCKVESVMLCFVDRSLWNLDLCVMLLPVISELITSKHKRSVVTLPECCSVSVVLHSLLFFSLTSNILLNRYTVVHCCESCLVC